MSKNEVRPTGKAHFPSQRECLLADQAGLEAIASAIAENKRLAFMVVHAWIEKNGLELLPKGWLNKNGLVLMPKK